MRKPVGGFCPGLTKSGPQKMTRGLKFLIKEVKGLFYQCNETKALISFAVTVKLICIFVLYMQDFS